MLGTNRDYESMVEDIDRKIAERERAMLSGGFPGAAAALSDLRDARQTIRMLLLNRRVEASKRLVDFARWKDGDGALYRRASRPAARHRPPESPLPEAAPSGTLPSTG